MLTEQVDVCSGIGIDASVQEFAATKIDHFIVSNGSFQPHPSQSGNQVNFKWNLQGALASSETIETCSGAIFNRSAADKEDKSRTQSAEQKTIQHGARAAGMPVATVIDKGNLREPAFVQTRPDGRHPAVTQRQRPGSDKCCPPKAGQHGN